MQSVLKSVYLHWVLIVGGLIGGALVIWNLAEKATPLVNHLLIADPSGVELKGIYLINTLVIFLYLFLLLLLIVIILSILRISFSSKVNIPNFENLKLKYQDTVDTVSAIATSLYPDTRGLPRVDTTEKKIIISVEEDSTSLIVDEFTLRCDDKPAHCKLYTIFVDDESDPVFSFRDLNMSVKDLSNGGTDLYWLPAEDNPRKKKALIFFKEMAPGEEKKIQVRFTWPKYFNELLDKKSVMYSQSISSKTRSTTDLKIDFVFKGKFPKTKCSMMGDHSGQATISSRIADGNTIWKFRDSEWMADGTARNIRIEIE